MGSLKHISEGLPNIHEINLSFCVSVTDTGLKSLSRVSALRELNLRSCDNVSDIGVGFLAEGCLGLDKLDVSFVIESRTRPWRTSPRGWRTCARCRCPLVRSR